jgi:hypothetical protein
MHTQDQAILRDLAKQYSEMCAQPVQDERRALWRRHNSLKKTRPLICARRFAWHEMPQAECRCEDPLARHIEKIFSGATSSGTRWTMIPFLNPG